MPPQCMVSAPAMIRPVPPATRIGGLLGLMGVGTGMGAGGSSTGAGSSGSRPGGVGPPGGGIGSGMGLGCCTRMAVALPSQCGSHEKYAWTDQVVT